MILTCTIVYLGEDGFCCVVLVTQSCPTLHDLMDCSPPGPSVHEIFQARILEWVAISFSSCLFSALTVNSLGCDNLFWEPCILDHMFLKKTLSLRYNWPTMNVTYLKEFDICIHTGGHYQSQDINVIYHPKKFLISLGNPFIWHLFEPSFPPSSDNHWFAFIIDLCFMVLFNYIVCILKNQSFTQHNYFEIILWAGQLLL